MKRSTERILTTHAGSLPRPDDLREMLIAKEEGRPFDKEAFAQRVRSAVAEVVERQIASGIDIVNDGEESKRSFTTYARERLAGLETRPAGPGEGFQRIFGRDIQEFPEYFAGRADLLGGRQIVCVGPLTYIGHEAVRTDIENLKAALAGKQVEEAFLTAVAPGTIEHWLKNEHYPSTEAFLYAIADAMHEEYKAITDAGFILQIDDPDLADAWQIHADMDVPTYRSFAKLRIEALNHASPRSATPTCTPGTWCSSPRARRSRCSNRPGCGTPCGLPSSCPNSRTIRSGATGLRLDSWTRTGSCATATRWCAAAASTSTPTR